MTTKTKNRELELYKELVDGIDSLAVLKSFWENEDCWLLLTRRSVLDGENLNEEETTLLYTLDAKLSGLFTDSLLHEWVDYEPKAAEWWG